MEEMMEEYQALKLEILRFESEDVITDSYFGDDWGEDA